MGTIRVNDLDEKLGVATDGLSFSERQELLRLYEKDYDAHMSIEERAEKVRQAVRDVQLEDGDGFGVFIGIWNVVKFVAFVLAGWKVGELVWGWLGW